jgi:hypothetical protein
MALTVMPVSPELIAAPAVVVIIANLRPSRSINGPTMRATKNVPTLTSVETVAAKPPDQPKSSRISGSSVPKRMKSYTENTQAMKAIQLA